MSQMTSVLIAVLSMLPVTPVLAKPNPVKLDPLVGKLDVSAMAPLLERGMVSLVESHEKSGRLQQVTVIGLVNAPQEIVWQVITDYPNYTRIFSNLDELEVVKKDGDDVILEYELEVPGPNLEYRLRHHHVPMRTLEISLADDEGDLQTGAWRYDLLPFDNGKKTIVIYTLYTDVRETSWVIRQVLKSNPTAEHGLNVATGIITIRSVKKEAEKRATSR